MSDSFASKSPIETWFTRHVLAHVLQQLGRSCQLALTLYQTILNLMTLVGIGLWKHCGKRRKCVES